MKLKKFLQGLLAAALPTGGFPVCDLGRWKPYWKIEKYYGEAKSENLYAVEEFEGNVMLDEGINEWLQLVIGAVGTTAFNNANARIGVGDSTTPADHTQNDLQAAVNKTYLTMDAGYPQVNNQTVTFKATAGPSAANFTWNEYVVDNGATAGKTANRKVESHGTKASGDTWVISCAITLS